MSKIIYISRVKELIRRWCFDKSINITELKDRDIIAEEGNNTVLIRIFYTEIPNEEIILREITYLSNERHKYNKVYIAIPEDAKMYLDGKLLKDIGIGVLTYNLDEGIVSEVLTSPAIKTSIILPNIDIEKIIDKKIEEHLKNIYLEIESIKQNLSKVTTVHTSGINDKIISLKNEIDSIWDIIERLKIEIEKIKNMCTGVEHIEKRIEHRVEKVEVKEMEVPEFIKDNPWIEILSKKVESS